MKIHDYIHESKTIAKIPAWPAQWGHGTVQAKPFLLADEGGVSTAQAYMAQFRNKDKWIVIARSTDMGMEDRSSTFNNAEDAEATFKQLEGRVSWGDLTRLLTWP